MVLNCPNCGAQLRLWDQICSRCGAPRPDDTEAYRAPSEALRRTKEHHVGPLRAPSATHAPGSAIRTDAPFAEQARAKAQVQKQAPGLELEKKHEDGCHQCGGTGVVEGVLPSDSDDPDGQRCNCLNGQCMYCKGEGACSLCKGFGMTPYGTCNQCNGNGKCAFCSGSGHCPICHGSGSVRAAWVACPRCGGTGEKYPEQWRRDRDRDRDRDRERGQGPEPPEDDEEE